MNGKYENRKTEIVQKVNELNERLKEEQIDLEILPGQENRIYGEILEDYEKGEIQTLAGTSYLFIEFPSGHVPATRKPFIRDTSEGPGAHYRASGKERGADSASGSVV